MATEGEQALVRMHLLSALAGKWIAKEASGASLLLPAVLSICINYTDMPYLPIYFSSPHLFLQYRNFTCFMGDLYILYIDGNI